MASAFAPIRLPVPKCQVKYNSIKATIPPLAESDELYPRSVVINAADVFSVEEFGVAIEDGELYKFCRVYSASNACVYVGLSEEELMGAILQALNNHMQQQLNMQMQMSQAMQQRQQDEAEAAIIAAKLRDPRKFTL